MSIFDRSDGLEGGLWLLIMGRVGGIGVHILRIILYPRTMIGSHQPLGGSVIARMEMGVGLYMVLMLVSHIYAGRSMLLAFRRGLLCTLMHNTFRPNDDQWKERCSIGNPEWIKARNLKLRVRDLDMVAESGYLRSCCRCKICLFGKPLLRTQVHHLENFGRHPSCTC